MSATAAITFGGRGSIMVTLEAGFRAAGRHASVKGIGGSKETPQHSALLS